MASAQAHDPSEHMKKGEKPKCESMKNMDHSKMDANDPIMMAMIKKCMGEEPADNHHAEDAEGSEAADSSTEKVDQTDKDHGH